MKRNSTLVSVIAATGIVGATVIAAISLMQATITSGSESDTVTLAAPSATDPMSPDLVFNPSQLPEIPVISAPVAAESNTYESNTSKSSSSNEVAASSPSVGQIDRDYAIKAVVDATGGEVTKVDSLNHNGVDAFSVTVKRTDGSVVTGYVNKSTGAVYEWVVVKAAPVKQYEEEEYEEEEYEEDEDEEGEYEEDERENDDD
jgi:hypothetical protein